MILEVAAAMRILAYGTSADSLDETLQLAELTALKFLNRLIVAVVDAFSDGLLAAPTADQSRLFLH